MLRILQILNAPVWVLRYVRLFGRSVRRRVDAFIAHPSQYIKELTWDVRSQFCYFVSPWTPYTLFECYPWRTQCQGLHGRQRYLRYRWAVALDSTTSIHIGHHGRFSGPGTSLYWGLAESAGTTRPLPDQSQIKQGGPSFLQALGSMPVGADVILGCATRCAHLASADVADFLDGQDRLKTSGHTF